MWSDSQISCWTQAASSWKFWIPRNGRHANLEPTIVVVSVINYAFTAFGTVKTFSAFHIFVRFICIFGDIHQLFNIIILIFADKAVGAATPVAAAMLISKLSCSSISRPHSLTFVACPNLHPLNCISSLCSSLFKRFPRHCPSFRIEIDFWNN